jgi:hypothetical protein
MDSRPRLRHNCRMKVSLSFALWLLFSSGVALAQDNAGLFFYGPAPSVEAVDTLAKAQGATVSSEKDGAMTRLTVAWPDVSVMINIDATWQRDEQLSGIRGLLADFPARERNRSEVKQLLANLDRTTTCYGAVIDPGYDRERRVSAFLKALVAPTGGFLFTYQSFYSADGKRITGLQDDPATLE